jgi:hypothetical protein
MRAVGHIRIALLILLSCLIGICPQAEAKPDSKNPFWVTWEKIFHTDKNLFRVHFADAQTGWVVGQDGTILATRNGGTSWEKQHSGTDKHLLGVHFADKQIGWVVGQHGTILATRNGGTSWEAQHSGAYAILKSVHFADAQTGWVVGQGGTILATRNGGTSWQAQPSGTDKNLLGVHFADAQTGWVVGEGGTMLRAAQFFMSPSVDVSTVTAPTTSGGEVDVSFRIAGEHIAHVRKVSVTTYVGERWISVGEPTTSPGSDGRWHAAWNPKSYRLGEGNSFEYHVVIDDSGPPLPQFSIGSFDFLPPDPWWLKLWHEQHEAVLTALACLSILALYAGIFGFMLLLAPARLAYLGAIPGLNDLPKPSGNLAFLWDIARKGFEQFALPWLSRHPRVRRAWIELYRDGQSKIDDLGKIARTSFLSEPDVLDAWVARSAKKVQMALQQLDLFGQRLIYVEIPVRVGQRADMIERPNAETLRSMFAKRRAIILIVGTGGSGKSTLACAMARWALADDLGGRLAPHRMLPIFIVEDTSNLAEAVTQNLRRMLGDEEIPDDLVRGLLAKQRLLVIVDALSEREPETQKHIEQVFAKDMPINAMVITSRSEPNLGAVDRTVLYPVRLDAARIVPFIIGYLDRMETVARLKDGRMQLQLGERILALAESGGRKTPVTPLLVTLFVNSAVKRAADGQSFDDMPEAVPEVFVDYLRRVNVGGLGGPLPDDLFIRAAQTIASVSLGRNLIPQDFSPDAATEALAKNGAKDQASSLIDRLIATGVVERRTPGGYVVLRFNLDPATEYLAAIRQLMGMRTATREEWQAYLSALEETDGYPKGPEGYLVALATCYRTYRTDFSLPDVHFPWETAPATGTAA